MKTLITNGTLCLEDRLVQENLLIKDGTIRSIGSPSTAIDGIDGIDETIDAGGLYVLPGFIDIHTHLDERIGQFNLADTYESGTRVAVMNGVTTIFSFITQERDESLVAAIQRTKRKAEGNCHCHHSWHLTPTRFDISGWNEIDQCVERGFKTFKFYTTYKNAGIFTDYDLLEEIIRRLAPRDVRFLIHCEDEGVLHYAQAQTLTAANPFSHALSRPPEAEGEAIQRIITLAEKLHARVHIVHVSTPEGLKLIEGARSRAKITCETGPQYLFLNDSQLKFDNGHHWICSPPLRDEYRRKDLRQYAFDGMIDVFATDHCAFQKEHKDAWGRDFRNVPNGLPGLGALPHLMLQVFDLFLPDAFVRYANCLSTNPAKITGLYPQKGAITVGADADLVLLRLNGPPRPIISSLQDVHEPYPHHTSTLQIDRVLLNGETVAKMSELLHPGIRKGTCLCP
jgi:dihydropyrimidinase